MKRTTFAALFFLLPFLSIKAQNGIANKTANTARIQNKIEDGIYLLKGMGVKKSNLLPNASEAIIPTNLLFEHNALDPNKYYVIDTKEFVPIKITKKPTISANPTPKIAGDTTRLSQLRITLLPKYAKLLEDFTTKHVNQKITIVIGGKAITKHRVREPIVGGSLQISRCTDEACTVLLSEMEKSMGSQNEPPEELAIKRAILNYIENFFENNFEEMNKSLHPRLAKRGLNPDGVTMSDDFPPEKLKELMTTKPKFAKKHQYNVVKDVMFYGNMASASLKTGYPKTRWTEYIHLVKQNGDWKIINVFWEFQKKEKE